MLFEITVPSFTKALQNLNTFLDKAAQFADAKKFDVEVLLNSRLAPDQFHFIKQIQIVCDTAKLGAAKLAGKEAPVHDDKEKTISELKNRIEETLTYLKTFKPDDFKGAEERKITNPRWEGKYLSGYDYALHYSIPNLYFHMTTAYSILRHNGVDLGKKDFLGVVPFKN